MSLKTEAVPPMWRGEAAIVAAPGPSLTPASVEACRLAHARGTHRIVAVQDAYRLMPWSDILYGCDPSWWKLHTGCPSFAGEKWSTHEKDTNDKTEAAGLYGLRVVAGKQGHGFSMDPAVIHYGMNSGFQSVNLTILLGVVRVVLVGFDMRTSGGKRHFFGDHPRPLHNSGQYATFISNFDRAARMMHPGVSIVNATPGSALKCFPMVPLADALSTELAA
jgi:hypothetical protein